MVHVVIAYALSFSFSILGRNTKKKKKKKLKFLGKKVGKKKILAKKLLNF